MVCVLRQLAQVWCGVRHTGDQRNLGLLRFLALMFSVLFFTSTALCKQPTFLKVQTRAAPALSDPRFQ